MRLRIALPSTHRISGIGLAAPLAIAALLVPTKAHAISGLYAHIALGYGQFSGDQLIVEEEPAGPDIPKMGEGCCVPGGFAGDLRIGFSFFGIAGELGVVGEYFGGGGGGFYGGGLRFFPLDILALVGLESDLPIDLHTGVLVGPVIVGKEFAYTGVGFVVDFVAEYKVADFMSAGIKLDLGFPTFSDFVFTDYKNDTGRCLDAGGRQIIDQMSPGSERVKKENANCKGTGPSSTLLAAPLLVLTFHFNPLE
jgi:hypothetical protein